MPYAFAQRIVAITGGASGIGLATARHLGEAGAVVIVLDRQAPPADLDARHVPVDVSDEASVATAFAQVARDHGGLAGLVNSAGVESARLLPDLDSAAWDRVLGVNLRGTMLCTRAAVALMRGPQGTGGSVVNVASIAGKRMSYSGDAAYTASKGAVLAFTRHAAFELAAARIRVNAVCPGPTITPMITRNLSAERMAQVARTIPLGRWVEADDVAQAIAFLLSDAAAMCTGTSLDVDGGMLVSNGASHADYFAARQAAALPVPSPSHPLETPR